MTRLKIKVTKDILERSKMCGAAYASADDQKEATGANCAIVLAIRDILPEAYVETYRVYPFFYSDDETIFREDNSIELPMGASVFIREFDENSPEERVEMDELEFEIEMSDEVVEKLVDIEEIKKLLVNHPTLELV